jgi:hypothetical protein
MPRKEPTVSIRVHTTIKAIIDYIITNHRARTGQGLTNDEALWMAFTDEKVAKEAIDAVLKMGAKIPVDERQNKEGKGKGEQ